MKRRGEKSYEASAHMLKKSERGKKQRCICIASKTHAAVEEKWEGQIKNEDFSQLLSYFSVNVGESVSFVSRRGRFPGISQMPT